MNKIFGSLLVMMGLFAFGTYAQGAAKIEDIVGIGATLEKRADGAVQVDAFIPNAPAERAGLAVGDVIMNVKSTPTAAITDIHGLSLNDAVALIRGPIGVPVELSFVRGGSDLEVLSIVREKFEVSDDE